MSADPTISRRAEVIVIGGGPAGSAAALRLARQGRHVLQFERRIFGAPENDRWRSGEGILPATLRELAQLDIPPDPAWLLQRARGVRIRWPGGAQTLDLFPNGRTIGALDR